MKKINQKLIKRISVMAVPGLLTVLLILAVTHTGCGGAQAGEETVPDIDFPEFVYRSEDALKGYRLAVTYADDMQYIPCYCGCKQDAEKYQSLKDCFINRKTGEYDEHAAGCGICLEEAIDIGKWKKEGLSTKEIRDRIDTQYAERGEPTDTPMPPE